MKNAIRFFALFAAMTVGAMLDVTDAYAQANACVQLQRQLAQLERNNDFRQGQSNADQSRQLASQVQDAESAYVRNGCNAAAKAGQQLTRECQQLARTIIKGRQQRDALDQSVQTAGAVSQQRETVLQEMMRFGCNSGSQATFSQQNTGNRGGLFDRLFGGYTNQQSGTYTEEDIVGDEFSGTGYGTLRTVCVRKTDGYFWPISYSTIPDYLGQDAYQCQEACPGTPVELYYYKNPGQEPEQMINLDGTAYTSMPNAFLYRRSVDLTASCKPDAPQGSISVVSSGGDGQTRSVIDFADVEFPMPLRDPRRPQGQIVAAPVQVASVALVDVPLPRRRPGSAEPTVTAQPSKTPGERMIQFGNKTVRIVGPDTPYAQVKAAMP